MAPGWTKIQDLGTVRHGSGGLFVNDHQFLVIGGRSSLRDKEEDTEYREKCEYYDTKTGSWSSVPILMVGGRAQFGVAKVRKTIYVVGGRNSEGIHTNSLLSLDLAKGDLAKIKKTKTWKIMEPMKEKRAKHACVAHKNFIYVFGGQDGKGDNLDTAERFDVEKMRWERLPEMPDGARRSCAAAVVGNNIYVVGGKGPTGWGALKSTIVFDIKKQRWKEPLVSDMKAGRRKLKVVAADGHVVAIGASIWDRSDSSSIEILDTNDNTWTLHELKMNAKREYAMADYCKSTEEIFVAGGFQEKTAETLHFKAGDLI